MLFPENNIPIKADDLFDELSKPTAEKNDITDDFNENDFLPPPPPPPPDEQEENKETPEQVKEKAAPIMPPDEAAEMLVDALDGLQQLAIPGFSRMKYLSREERKQIKEVRRKFVNKEKLSEAEDKLFRIYVLLKGFEDDLPFSEKERQFLIKPLSRLIEYSEKSMSPATGLIVAAATVIIPRIGATIALKNDIDELK